MASVSLATIIATVRKRGDFRNTIRYPDADITIEVQAAFCELWELVADTHQGWWDTIGTVSTVASQVYVALPSDCWRVQGIDRLTGADYYPLAQVGLADRNRYGSAVGEPAAYRPSARGVELYPTPGAIYTLRVTYTPTAPTLGAAREYFNGWEDYVVTGTLLRLDQTQEKPLGERQQELARQRERIVRGASERKSSGPEYLTLFDGDCCDDFEVPRP